MGTIAGDSAVSTPPIAGQLTGGEFDLTARAGDSFITIGSQFGENPKILARDNGKEVGDRLHAANSVHIDNRHIVSIEESDSIEVDLPQRMLFHFEDGELRGAYPVAVGRPEKQWQTPVGSFTVIQMRKDGTWLVPWSIRREEEAEGKAVVDEIEPGPNNPLGKYWIGLSAPVLGIHGTNIPAASTAIEAMAACGYVLTTYRRCSKTWVCMFASASSICP